MKTKNLIIAPAILMCLMSSGCKQVVTVEKIIVSCEKTFKVEETINKSDITVQAYYSDKTSEKVSDWVCDDFKDGKYTFKDEDAPSKTFKITYGGKEENLKVTVEALTEKDKFLKLYKPYSDTFQNATTVYTMKEISYSLNSNPSKNPSQLEYINKEGETDRTLLGDKILFGGGVYETKTLSNYIDGWMPQGGSFKCITNENGNVGFQIYKADKTTLVKEYIFNKNGYLLKEYYIESQGSTTMNVTYSGEPHDPII